MVDWIWLVSDSHLPRYSFARVTFAFFTCAMLTPISLLVSTSVDVDELSVGVMSNG